MSPLALLKEGETAEIVAYYGRHGHRHGHCHGHKIEHGQDHIINMGLRPGKRVEMITNRGTGPIVLRLDECRIALGRGIAMKIYVRRNEA